jgi:hypothetical protein
MPIVVWNLLKSFFTVHALEGFRDVRLAPHQIRTTCLLTLSPTLLFIRHIFNWHKWQKVVSPLAQSEGPPLRRARGSISSFSNAPNIILLEEVEIVNIKGIVSYSVYTLLLVSVPVSGWRSLANTVISSHLSTIICLLACDTSTYRCERSVIQILLSSFYKFASLSPNRHDRAVGVRNIDHKSLQWLRRIECLHRRICAEELEEAHGVSIWESPLRF